MVFTLGQDPSPMTLTSPRQDLRVFTSNKTGNEKELVLKNLVEKLKIRKYWAGKLTSGEYQKLY